MAEIVGLVSGGAGFVSVMIQVAECAVKLRYFGQRVRFVIWQTPLLTQFR